MNLHGVAGRPILHSKTPLVHSLLFGRAGLPSVRVAADSPEELAGLARNAGFRVMNVTAPFKQSLLPFCDGLDASAAEVGAVNVVVNAGGRLVGSNTDPAGVLFPLRRRGIALSGLRSLVLGAGGAGRAAVAALVRSGGRVTVVNRTDAKAEACAAAFGCRWMPFRSWRRRLEEFGLLVNTVPVASDEAEAAAAPPGLVVLDALYADRPFARFGRRRGCLYIPGEEWLFGQALECSRTLPGVRPRRAAPPASLFEPLYPRRKTSRVSLIGIMGSGKSTVGRLLARKLGRKIVETDDMVAEREGMPVRDIFRRRGENAFRAAEREAVERAVEAPSAVLALGGGAVLHPASRAALRRNSIVVWIHVRPDAAFERVSGSDRPLLAAMPGREAFRKLCDERLSLYAAAADVMIDGNKTPEKTASRIHEEIHRTVGN